MSWGVKRLGAKSRGSRAPNSPRSGRRRTQTLTDTAVISTSRVEWALRRHSRRRELRRDFCRRGQRAASPRARRRRAVGGHSRSRCSALPVSCRCEPPPRPPSTPTEPSQVDAAAPSRAGHCRPGLHNRYRSRRRLGSRLATFVALLEVLAGVAFAWLLPEQLPRPVLLLGSLLILAGVVAAKLGEQTVIRRGPTGT